MHVAVRNIGGRIVARTDTVVSILAVRDGAVLLGIEPVAAKQPQEEGAAIPVYEATTCPPPGG